MKVDRNGKVFWIFFFNVKCEELHSEIKLWPNLIYTPKTKLNKKKNQHKTPPKPKTKQKTLTKLNFFLNPKDHSF